LYKRTHITIADTVMQKAGLGSRSRSQSRTPSAARFGGTRATLFFLQETEPEHLKKLEWIWSWSRSYHTLMQLQAPAVFNHFKKIKNFEINLQQKAKVLLLR